MRSPITLFSLCLAALALSACDKDRQGPPRPAVAESAQAFPGAAPGNGNTSVPSADAVLKPATATPGANTPAGRANQRMTGAEESASMPMAGQNNDHSAPLPPAARASAP